MQNNIKKSDKVYLICYFTVFVFAIFARFARGQLGSNGIEQLSLLFSFAISIWDARRRGVNLTRLLGWLFTIAMLILLPTSLAYKSVSFGLMSLFLLGPAIDVRDTGFIRRLFTVKLLAGILILSLYALGYLPDVIGYNYQKELTLHSYGFMHPNSLSMYATSVLMDYYLWQKSRCDWLVMSTTTLIGLLIYASTDSRLGLFVFLAVLLLAGGKRWLQAITLPSWGILLGIGALFTLGILPSTFYQAGDNFSEFLNRLLTKRPANAHLYIEAYGYHIWPRELAELYYDTGRWRGNENFYIDALLRFGLVVYSFFPAFLISWLARQRLTLYHTLFLFLALGIAMIEHYGASVLMCSILLVGYWGNEADAVLKNG